MEPTPADGNTKKKEDPKALLKNGMFFSKRQLLVFGLVFAAVGGYFLWKGFALSGTTYSITSTVVDGSTISGPVDWTVTISPTPTKVEYYIDGVKNAYVDTSPPFTYSGDNKTLDTTKLSNGKHTLREVATYSNTTVSVSHIITVSNVSPTPTPTPTPTPAPPPPVGQNAIWLSRSEIQALPNSGSAWSNVLSHANTSVSTPDLQQRDSDNTNTYAKALVYAKTGDAKYAQEVRQILEKIIGTESGSDILAVLRNAEAYVIAADVIDLKSYDSAFDQRFRNWLQQMRTATSSGPCASIVQCHEKRPNNFGGHAFASRVAIARYLGDTIDLNKAIDIHKAWLGMPGVSHTFSWGGLDWQSDASKPVGINPPGSTKQGQSIDGVFPDDQRRAGGFTWPPPCENYVWGAIQGYATGTELLHRAGYPAWDWQNQAIRRAMTWLHSSSVKSQDWCKASGDDGWAPYLINKRYGTNFPATSGSIGKNMGFTDWTHAR